MQESWPSKPGSLSPAGKYDCHNALRQGVSFHRQGRLASCSFTRECLLCASKARRIFNALPNDCLDGHLRVSMEMRKELRFRLEAPAMFFWEGANQRRFQGEGITRDISLQGAFILTATSPPAECSVQLDLFLPPISGMKASLRITGRVRVVRVDHPREERGMDGFAVVSDEPREWGLTTIRADSHTQTAPEFCGALKPILN